MPIAKVSGGASPQGPYAVLHERAQQTRPIVHKVAGGIRLSGFSEVAYANERESSR